MGTEIDKYFKLSEKGMEFFKAMAIFATEADLQSASPQEISVAYEVFKDNNVSDTMLVRLLQQGIIERDLVKRNTDLEP